MSNDPSIAPTAPRYATFTRRFRALVIDNAIVSGVAIVVFMLGEAASDVPGSGGLTWLLMLGVVVLYEPVLVSRRGATVGHSASDLEVVEAGTGRWPSFRRALARFLLKVVVGFPSFVTMALSRRHQAVHDLLTGTTVQLPATADTAEFHLARDEEPNVQLPTRRRRLAVIVVYLVTVFFLYGVSLNVLDPDDCLSNQSCPGSTLILVNALWLVWIALSLATIVAGWRGQLLGARRTRPADADVAVS